MFVFVVVSHRRCFQPGEDTQVVVVPTVGHQVRLQGDGIGAGDILVSVKVVDQIVGSAISPIP
jgi:hypothetical protein